MVDFNQEKILQQAAAQISESILHAAGERHSEIAERFGVDGDTADLMLAMAFLHATAALCSVAYRIDERAAGKGFNKVITDLINQSRKP
jgi:hypothetical protein